MILSRDLSILLVLMGVGFLIGCWVAESSEYPNPERTAITGAFSSVGGMLAAFAYLAIEKRMNASSALPRRKPDFVRQVVGESCQKCTGRVIFVTEAFFCTECGGIFHRRCGKPPRCAPCDERISFANRVILAEWDYDPYAAPPISTPTDVRS
jgi:hypothetical protein